MPSWSPDSYGWARTSETAAEDPLSERITPGAILLAATGTDAWTRLRTA